MKKFKISVGRSEIDDLYRRLDQTRWPDEIQESNWKYGTDLSYLKELCSYWRNNFDWSRQENNLNSFDHYKTQIDHQDVHFIYQKGKGSKNIPLMLIHGWPDSFYRFIKLISLLIESDENGVAFDVIIPSIPGFGYSGRSNAPGMGTKAIATLFNQLMSNVIGNNQFIVHGGDWGASIATHMALANPLTISSLHLTNVPPELFFTADAHEFNQEELEYLKKAGERQKKEGGYLAIQSTKPQTIAYALNDSPAGLAGWIIEKFHSWSDSNIKNRFSNDELLTNLSIYWFTQKAGSAARLYREAMHQEKTAKDIKINVPTYFAIFPQDPIQIPESFARRIYNIKSWSNMNFGGHFAAMEMPELLAESLRTIIADTRLN